MMDLFGFTPRPRGTLEIMHGGAAGHRRDRRDLYTEPVAVTSALLAIERFPEPVLDPACGTGNILAALRRAGHQDVRGTDASTDPRNDFLRSTSPSRPRSSAPSRSCAWPSTPSRTPTTRPGGLSKLWTATGCRTAPLDRSHDRTVRS